MRLAAAAAIALIALQGSAIAGPCASDIVAAQNTLDSREKQDAAAGPSLPESSAAKMHRQPTPASIAQAEARGGRGNGALQAAKALDRARQDDQKNDEAACRSELSKANSLLKTQ